MTRAPLAVILPSFTPVILEKGVPGYEGTTITVAGERRLSRSEIRSLLVACIFIGGFEQALKQNLEFERIRDVLTRSLASLNDLQPEERSQALQLVNRFLSYKIIRAEHPFDDWVCEALWDSFQVIPYVYPSTLSGAISYGLTVNKSLSKCSIEY